MMTTWWAARNPRERVILVAGAAVVIAALIWALLLDPLSQRRDALARAVPEQRALLNWMESIPADGARRATSIRDSLFAVVDRSARSTALAGTLSRVQPEGADTVRVWLDDAPFNELVAWMASLEYEHGVRVTAVAVDRTATPGRVSARVTLARP